MTEQEWWTCSSPGTRLSSLSTSVSARKGRLFAVGCCYHIWGLLVDNRSRQAVRVAESFADGAATAAELAAAHEEARRACWDLTDSASLDAAQAAVAASDPEGEGDCLASDLACDASGNLARAAQHALLEELLGNPFRPATLDFAWLRWRDGTVPRLAQAIYAERAFDRMPVLGDALEDAGCAGQEVLRHCRSGEDHVRGCWALDLMLGKA